MNEFFEIIFSSENIEIVKDEYGTGWVSVRRICENIGINFKSQHRKLVDDEDSVVVNMTITGSDGKNYSMFCIRYDQLAGWLFTIKSSKVNPLVKAKLKIYKTTINKAVHDFVHYGFALSENATENQIDNIRLLIEQRDSALKLADERGKQIQDISTDVKFGTLNKWGKPRVLTQKHTLKAYPVTEEEKESFYKKLIDKNNNLHLQG